MESTTLKFNISSDYRTGYRIDVLYSRDEDEDDDEYDDKDEATSVITFELPKEGSRVYIVNEYTEYKPIWHKDIDEFVNYEMMYLKIFSQIHGCLPFRVTGMTSAYKEMGEYPNITEEIKALEGTEQEIIDKIIDDYHGYYFVCVIDSDGNELFTKLLQPIY